jgi:ankyrin repeat protein
VKAETSSSWDAAPAAAAPAAAAPAAAPVSDEDFMEAVESDNLAVVRGALAGSKAQANKRSSDGDYPLSLVTSVEMANLLMEAGADVNAVSPETGETPLFGVSLPALVALFVSKGASLDHKNPDGQTALEVFEEDENAEMVAAIKAALAAPAPAAAPAADFLTSVEENDVEGVRAAIASNPAVVNTPSEDGDLPLSLCGSVEVAQLLLDAKANVNAVNLETGETPIFGISEPALVAVLVAAGADLNHTEDNGETPLQVFTSDENAEMVAAINAALASQAPAAAPAPAATPATFISAIENDDLDGARNMLAVDASLASTSSDGEFPLGLVISVEMAELLFANGADVNAVSEETGETALFGISNPALVPLFVSKGASLDAKNEDGQTALEVFTEDENADMVAALNAAAAPAKSLITLVEDNEVEAVAALLASDATLANTQEDGEYPLSMSNSPEMAQLLLDAKANVNALNQAGESPLFCISNPALVPILVSAGADLSVANEDGETAMQVFEADENAEMVAALKAASE